MKLIDNLKQNFEALKPESFLNKTHKLKNRKNYHLAKGNDDKVSKYDEKLTEVISNSKALDALTLENKLTQKAKLEEVLVANENDLEAKRNIEVINDFEDFNNDENSHLKISNLSMHFGGLKAVDNLNIEVKKGEIYGLIGPNGAGKTTVFNCITQFYKPTFGDVFFRDSDNTVHSLINYKTHNVIKVGLARTFQNIELIWELNILDNMLVGGQSLYTSGFFTQLLHLPKLNFEDKMLKAKAIKILEELGIAEYMYSYPMGLPYGILKKIELARTLMTNPSLIILDEPAAGLNDTETVELAKFIREIRNKYNLTIFLVEHDMGLVMDVCDRICAISFGKKLAVGTPEEIQSNPLVKEAYLGGE